MYTASMSSKPAVTLQLGCDSNVMLTVIEDDGSLVFLLGAGEGVASPEDINGLFINFSNEAAIDGVTIYPEVDTQDITSFEADANGVDSLPDGFQTASSYDLALQFGTTAGSSDGEVTEVGFTLWTTGTPLTLADIDFDSLGVVVENSEGASEFLCGTEGEEPELPEEPESETCDKGDDDDHHGKGHHGKDHDKDDRHHGKGHKDHDHRGKRGKDDDCDDDEDKGGKGDKDHHGRGKGRKDDDRDDDKHGKGKDHDYRGKKDEDRDDKDDKDCDDKDGGKDDDGHKGKLFGKHGDNGRDVFKKLFGHKGDDDKQDDTCEKDDDHKDGKSHDNDGGKDKHQFDFGGKSAGHDLLKFIFNCEQDEEMPQDDQDDTPDHEWCDFAA